MEHDHHHAAPDVPSEAETAKDPVCGMTVTVKPGGRHAEFQGETFHFCSEKCQTKFKADPWFYASGRARSSPTRCGCGGWNFEGLKMAEEPNRWEDVYLSKEEAQTSWFEDRPQVSLDLIAATGATSNAAIVDVGAGASRLVDCLLELGFHRITVLDAGPHLAVSSAQIVSEPGHDQ